MLERLQMEYMIKNKKKRTNWKKYINLFWKYKYYYLQNKQDVKYNSTSTSTAYANIAFTMLSPILLQIIYPLEIYTDTSRLHISFEYILIYTHKPITTMNTPHTSHFQYNNLVVV